VKIRPELSGISGVFFRRLGIPVTIRSGKTDILRPRLTEGCISRYLGIPSLIKNIFIM
jgi:hypothetical protein